MSSGAPWWRRALRWLTRAVSRRARRIAREVAAEAEREAVRIVREGGERARDALDDGDHDQ